MKTNKGKREGRKTRMIMVTKGGCGSVERGETGGLSTVTSRFDSRGVVAVLGLSYRSFLIARVGVPSLLIISKSQLM